MQIFNMKKLFKKIILIILILVFICPINYVRADDDDEIDESNIVETIQNEEVETASTSTLNKINSRRYVVFDRKSNTDVFGRDQDKQTPMASTTKIMTALVAIENCKDLNEIITVDKKATQIGGSKLKIKTGDKITVKDMLYGMMLRSGNDASIALAIHISGSVENFVNKMNEKAKELKLIKTHFKSPYGLDDPSHYTTPHELALLTDYALENETISKIVSTKRTTIKINNESREILNTNELLNSNIDGVYGVKTGFTNEAGRCLVTSVKRDNMDLIIVVLKADTRKDRAKDTLNLLKYTQANYRTINIEEKINEEFENWKNINLNRIYIDKAQTRLKVKLSNYKIKNIVLKEDPIIDIISLNYFQAPVLENQKIGTIIVKSGNNIIEEIDILAEEEVKHKNVIDYLKMFAKVYCA